MADQFKNPWGEGSAEYSKWQPGHDANNQYLKWLPQGAAFFDELQEDKQAKWDAVFGDKSTSTDAVELENEDGLYPGGEGDAMNVGLFDEGDSGNEWGLYQNRVCNASKQAWWVEWFDREGFKIYQLSRKGGFSVTGSLLVLAHAYNEQATSGRTTGYKYHNWWNISAIKAKGQTNICDGKKQNFACFSSVEEAFNAYYDRLTSPSDLNAYKNPKFNPSYPEVGELFRKNTLLTAQQLDDAFRIGGEFVYCGEGCHEYGADILSIYNKYINIHFRDFLNFKINCLSDRKRDITSSDDSWINDQLYDLKKVRDEIGT